MNYKTYNKAVRVRILPLILLLAAARANADCSLSDPTVHVRRDIYHLAKTPAGQATIDSLRKGVSAMMRRPESDPTSWLSQANIHGIAPGDATHPLELWSNCQHGSFFFFSWHRMYLYFFERILRKASGDPDFGLPYWNYSDPTESVLPDSFRTPADRSNVLYLPNPSLRSDDSNSGSQMPDDVSSFAQAFGFINFDSQNGVSSPNGTAPSFGGQIVSQPVHFGDVHGELESQPHDVVHVWVGGEGAPGARFPGWMSDPDTAARDPVFWIHHANIDRLWKRWLERGAGRQNPISDNKWMTQKFTFYDENGAKCSLSGKEVLDTAQQLSYRYDDDPATSPTPMVSSTPGALAATSKPFRNFAAAAPETPGSLEQKQTTVRLRLNASISNDTFMSAAATPQQTVLLNIEGVNYERPPGVYYQVYLNLPEGTRPDPHGPYYVGNLSLFALKGGTRRFDITKVVGDLKAKGMWKPDQLAVTMVAYTGSKKALAATENVIIPGKPSFARITISGR
jgi:tyrosinase